MKTKYKNVSLCDIMISPRWIFNYNGISIYIQNNKELIQLGNYLGTGTSGCVYEGYDYEKRSNVAIKILNPLGYKLIPSFTLQKCKILKHGIPLSSLESKIKLEHIYWLLHPNNKDIIAACVPLTSNLSSEAMKQNQQLNFKEISLDICFQLWNEYFDITNDIYENVNNNNNSYYIQQPQEEDKCEENLFKHYIPTRLINFLKDRKIIYKEIANMHKLTGNICNGIIADAGHPNIIKLYDVLEFVQPSKLTIFLVLELATSGELFDRLKEFGRPDEVTSMNFFNQILNGVIYCHNRGIVHRDLKPENLLLSDDKDGKPVLKIADFGLSAHYLTSKNILHSTIKNTKEKCSYETLKNHKSSKEMYISQDDSYDTETNTLYNFSDRSNTVYRVKSVVGSPHYVAPEVLQSTQLGGYDGMKADAWSLGVILYGMVCQSLPFNEDLQSCSRFNEFTSWVSSLPENYSKIKIKEKRARLINNTFSDTDETYEDEKLNYPLWFFPSILSADVKFLLTSLLDPDPFRRLSCEEAREYTKIYLTDKNKV